MHKYLEGHVRDTGSAVEVTIKVKVGRDEKYGWYVSGSPVDTAAGANFQVGRDGPPPWSN